MDVITLTATEASQLLTAGKTTCLELVEAYLAQIEEHNHRGLHLNALISLTPREKILNTAKRLDAERKSGKIRGPLHGIPFVIKDIFALHPDTGLNGTCGAPCFASSRAQRTAPIIEHLVSSGMILLGTANMTEFCGLKYDKLTPGFSPMGGQTVSPYIYGGLEKDESVLGHSAIGGSSSGSAAAVAAGFAPLAIGSECCGSLITPANRGACYGLKCGLDAVDIRGVFHYTDITDFLGGMAKTTKDLAPFIQALMQKTAAFDLNGGFKGLKVGFLDPEAWLLSEDYLKFPGNTRQDVITAFHDARKQIADAGAQTFEKIDSIDVNKNFKHNDKSMFYEISTYQLRHTTFNAWLDELEYSEVRSVADMIKWNVDHADKCLPLQHPYQNQFYDLLHDRISAEEYEAMVKEFQNLGRGLDKLFDEMDVIIAPAESTFVRYTSAAGCPSACAPLSTVKYSDENSRPFGVCFAARRGNEGLLLRCLQAFEQLYPNRPLPRPLLEG